MAIFFFFVTLEIKREFLQGELSNIKQALLPIIAAVGGMVVPALFYVVINYGNAETINGWAIPSATDIAFSLGILQLLGKRVPLGLKVFLTTFAVIDDIGAIVVIAIFYSHGFHVEYLSVAIGLLLILWLLNYLQIFSKYLFLIFGLAIWVLFLKSGVHPTIAGVLLAFRKKSNLKIKKKDELTIKLEKNVELTGRIDSDELKFRYSSCDVYVSASTFEVCPVPTLEAMACGKPLVLFDIEPHREMIEISNAGKIFSFEKIANNNTKY